MSSAEQFFSLLRYFQYLTIAAETFLIHDYFLTFSLEVDHIWHSRWSAVKVIFLLSRYGSLVGQSAYTLGMLGVLSHGSSKFCERFEGFVIFYGVFQAEAIRILVLVRAWAIWGCKRYVAILLIFAYVVYISVVSGMLIYAMVLVGGQDLPYLSETGACVMQSSQNTKSENNWIMPSISFVLDGIVFFMVALSLSKLLKETQCLPHPRSLARKLAVDAILYIAVITVISVIGILSQTVFLNNPMTNLLLVSNPLVVAIGQRVVLNLRSMESLPYSQQAFDLNIVTDSSLLFRSAQDSRRVLDGPGDPPAQQDLDHHGHETASRVEMVDMP